MKIAIGIEIGGTKIQVGAGRAGKEILALARTETDLSRGADGIRDILPSLVEQALAKGGFSLQDVAGIGVGFGGPVDSKNGITLISPPGTGMGKFSIKKNVGRKILRSGFHPE